MWNVSLRSCKENPAEQRKSTIYTISISAVIRGIIYALYTYQNNMWTIILFQTLPANKKNMYKLTNM